MLSAGLRVFEALEGAGRGVRITNLDDLQLQKIPNNPSDPRESLPGDPSREILDLSGTVVDGSGHSWDLDMTGNPGFTTGDVDLQGRCGRGRPAPASQQSPGAINYPCEEIQIEFAPANLNPRAARVAQWTTVKVRDFALESFLGAAEDVVNNRSKMDSHRRLDYSLKGPRRFEPAPKH
jgi:hypothetical protein